MIASKIKCCILSHQLIQCILDVAAHQCPQFGGGFEYLIVCVTHCSCELSHGLLFSELNLKGL